MMKMAAGLVVFYVVLVLIPTPVSAVQRLDSIRDLKRLNFGSSVPKNALVLLHWFANTAIINYNNDLIRLTFDPNGGDYGSHHYGNYEQLLERLPNNYQYYTLGNINLNSQRQLPEHITNPRSEYAGGNRARIIVRVRMYDNAIDRVYITQHSPHPGSEYDPDHTYQVSTNLLRQIGQFSMQGNHNLLINLRDRFATDVDYDRLRQIQQDWGRLSCLGLLLVMVQPTPTYHFNNQSYTRPQRDEQDCCRNLLKCIGYVLLFIVVLVFLGAHAANNNKY